MFVLLLFCFVLCLEGIRVESGMCLIAPSIDYRISFFFLFVCWVSAVGAQATRRYLFSLQSETEAEGKKETLTSSGAAAADTYDD